MRSAPEGPGPPDRFGFGVTLLEQHSIPGGYATSFERGDFTFDVSLHATVAEHAMPQMILEDLGVWKDLDVAYTPELRRIITDRFDITLPAKDPEGVKARLSQQFPHEEKRASASPCTTTCSRDIPLKTKPP